MPGDAGDDDGAGDSEPEGPEDADDVETWPPEEQEAGPDRPTAPDREHARQGTREPPSSREAGPRHHRGMSDSDARNWAAGAHLASLVALVGIPSIVGPLIVWLVKRDDHPFVADQARESLNFQLSVIIYTIVGAIAALILTLATLGIGLLVVIPIALIFLVGVLLLPIFAAIKASEGQRYRYPLTMRLISASERREPAPT